MLQLVEMQIVGHDLGLKNSNSILLCDYNAAIS